MPAPVSSSRYKCRMGMFCDFCCLFDGKACECPENPNYVRGTAPSPQDIAESNAQFERTHNIIGTAYPKKEGSYINYEDGVALTYAPHPRQPGYRRWWVRIRWLFGYRLSKDALEDVEINIKDPE